ncbi:MAG TPA: plastocyanin/azurin family copper-binding protein [Ktedonobacterales bacterium]
MLVVKRLKVVSCLLALLAVTLTPTLAGCGSAKSNEVDMGVAAFQQSSATIKAGQAIHFVDPPTGGTHIICVGQGAQCKAQSGAPAELNATQGMQFNQGDIHDITFPTAGTYTVVCIIHPGMQVVITVTS